MDSALHPGTVVVGASVTAHRMEVGSPATVDYRRLTFGGEPAPAWRDSPSATAVFVSPSEVAAADGGGGARPTTVAVALDRQPTTAEVKTMQTAIWPHQPSLVMVDATIDRSSVEGAVGRLVGDSGRLVRYAMLVLFGSVVQGLGFLTAQRRRLELATRRALGATSRDLLMMLIGEHVAIGAASGLLGVAIASYSLVLLAAAGAQFFEPLGVGAIVQAVCLPALGAALLVTLPMLSASRTDPATVFRSSSE